MSGDVRGPTWSNSHVSHLCYLESLHDPRILDLSLSKAFWTGAILNQWSLVFFIFQRVSIEATLLKQPKLYIIVIPVVPGCSGGPMAIFLEQLGSNPRTQLHRWNGGWHHQHWSFKDRVADACTGLLETPPVSERFCVCQTHQVPLPFCFSVGQTHQDLDIACVSPLLRLKEVHDAVIQFGTKKKKATLQSNWYQHQIHFRLPHSNARSRPACTRFARSGLSGPGTPKSNRPIFLASTCWEVSLVGGMFSHLKSNVVKFKVISVEGWKIKSMLKTTNQISF